MPYLIEFLDASNMIVCEMHAVAESPANAFLRAVSEWPPHAVTARVVDRYGRILFACQYRGMMNNAEALCDPQQLRARADETRALANKTKDADAKQAMLFGAQGYEQLAELMESARRLDWAMSGPPLPMAEA
jgi:hypothetical protein